MACCDAHSQCKNKPPCNNLGCPVEIPQVLLWGVTSQPCHQPHKKLGAISGHPAFQFITCNGYSCIIHAEGFKDACTNGGSNQTKRAGQLENLAGTSLPFMHFSLLLMDQKSGEATEGALFYNKANDAAVCLRADPQAHLACWHDA